MRTATSPNVSVGTWPPARAAPKVNGINVTVAPDVQGKIDEFASEVSCFIDWQYDITRLRCDLERANGV
jgi:hypothetical protein